MWNIIFMQHPPAAGLKIESIDLVESDDLEYIKDFLEKNVGKRLPELPDEYDNLLRPFFEFIDFYKDEFKILYLKTGFLYLEVSDLVVKEVLSIKDTLINRQTTKRLEFLNGIIESSDWGTWKQLIKQEENNVELPENG